MKKVQRTMITGFWVLLAGSMAWATGTGERQEVERLVLATTTSTENSGLLEELLPPFEEEYGVVVDVIAVGTGQALEIGRSGDADVLMVHAPALEAEFVAEGYGVERVYFMYNDFVVLGPTSDPAGVRDARDASGAFGAIAEAQAPFISRGDNSGTHVKELSMWSAAGEADVAGAGPWYREVGQGMGAVITLANEQQAYTLADRGTFLAYQGDIDLEIVHQGDPELFNPYGIIAVDPQRHPHVKVELAQALVDYVTSAPGQAIVDEYRIAGEQLFFPAVE
ncbi:MAG TPA: substrate-binding domain-containing protein [Alkalispirochaeta sp.]|nr:substrate-binding domain-containing protein [Alkalispirochaeta sp.]